MNKTRNISIFITTHAMDEAEALCDQIAIIDKGKIIFKGTADELKASLGQDMISVHLVDSNKLDESAERVRNLPEVENVKISDNKLNIGTKNGPKLVAVVAQALNSAHGNEHIEISAIEIKKPSLNDVFMYYTGKSFRHAEETSIAERLTMQGRKQRGRGGFRGGHR